MSIYYHPLNKNCKSITGAIPCKKELTLTLYDVNEPDCKLLLFRDGQEESLTEYPMSPISNGARVTISVAEPGLYFYYFLICGQKFGRGRERKGDFCNENYQLTVYQQNFSTPDSFKGGLIYQIFPDRFAKSGDIPIGKDKILRKDWGATPEFRPDAQGIVRNNDFFGGNLKGIESKLDYLKSLSVTTIYLNPIFESTSNHRYNTGNYLKIDSLLGTKEDFCHLIKSAKKKGIDIILDGVFNHTGDDSIYFNKYGNYESLGAYQSQQSPYYDWYSFSQYPDYYDSWWGIETLPAVNEQSESYQNFIFGEEGVLKTWLRCGIAGYRLDVADELPDFFLKKLRESVKSENPNAIIIGEVWEDASNKIAYGQRRTYFQGDELDSVMNYPLKNAILDFALTGNTANLVETIHTLIDHYPKDVLDCLMNNLSTHDTARILTVMSGIAASSKEEMAVIKMSDDERRRAIEKVKIASVLQYTMPGIPCLYYGDENGMEGYGDPFCRRCYDWVHQDKDLLLFYQKLCKIRSDLRDILSAGEYIEIYHDDHCLIFSRATAEKNCFIYANNGDSFINIKLNGEFTDLLTETSYKNQLSVQPFSYGILFKK